MKNLKNVLIGGGLLLLSILGSCTDLDDVKSRVGQLETEVADLQDTITLLKQAYDSGKIISELSPLDTEEGGWQLRFSDGTTISLKNGKDGAVISAQRDEIRNTVTFTLANGENLIFDMAFVTPTGIAIMTVGAVELDWGGQGSVEFRVNPSEAQFNYDVESEDCEIGIDCVNAVSRAFDVNFSTCYKLAKVEPVYNEDGVLREGMYQAVIEDLGKDISYDDAVALILNVTDVNGTKVQLSSSAFEVKSVAFKGIRTGLPIVAIRTPNNQNITSKENWMADVQMSVFDEKGNLDYQGTLSMKGRGNSTWMYPKKPYALKLDKKNKILGMKEHKRWCLLANWMDRTLIRNAVAFEISRKSGLEWTPDGKFVELVLNGKHVGNYWMCEQIKVDKNRVNVAELDPDAISGDGITGGYIFELDTYFDEVCKFKSSVYNLPWQFKDPDEVNEQQFAYVQDYVNVMENALHDEVLFESRAFAEYMDLESFVDWWFVYELSMNGEPNHPKSSYMNKDMNGKIKAGPVWDFDWGTFLPGSTERYSVRTAIYYSRLFQDPQFVALVKERWNQWKSAFETIPAFIEGLEEELAQSDGINSVMWPISSSVNGDEKMSYAEAVDRLKRAYSAKLAWLDAHIQQY